MEDAAMATEHTFKVTLSGFADAQVMAWVERMGGTPGITVADYPPMSRVPDIPVPERTAAAKPSPFRVGPRVTAAPKQPARVPMARPAPAAPVGLPISRTSGQPLAKPTTVPFEGANVHPSKGNNAWVAFDRTMGLRWLWNDDARDMGDGSSGAFVWKTKHMDVWYTPEEMYATR
jgi:hypothetical protein